MYIFGFDISGIVLGLKILGFLISLASAVGIVLALLGKVKIAQQSKDRFDAHFIVPEVKASYENDRWEMIKKHFQSTNVAEWRTAIIDADTMLEDLITSLGYTGENFGEKLKSMNHNNFPLLNEAWTVHKLRNVIAHQGSSYVLREREVFQTFKTYEHIFYEMGYIS